MTTAPLLFLVPVKSVRALTDFLITTNIQCGYRVLRVEGELPKLPEGAVALAFGTGVLNALKNLGLIKKNLTLTSSRGQVYQWQEVRFMVTFDPLLLLREAERLPEMQWDLQLAARLAITGTLNPAIGHYEYVSSLGPTINPLLAGESGAIQQVALDLETIGLDPFAPEAKIVSVSLTVSPGESKVLYVLPFGTLTGPDWHSLNALCTSPRIKMVGANLKFDALWLWHHWGIRITNHKLDTVLVGSLLDENRGNSLNMHAKLFTPLGGYDDPLNRRYDKSRMDLVPKEDLLPYAGGDTDAAYRVANVFRTMLSMDRRLRRFYVRLLQPASDTFTKLEHRGILVNRARYVELQQECEAEMDRLEVEIFKLMPGRLKAKYKDDLSLNRSVILSDFMFSSLGLNLKPKMTTVKKNTPSTSLEHFQMFSDVEPAKKFVDLMRQYSVARKTLTTYIIGFMQHIRSDGKFHPNFRLARGGSVDSPEGGTVTGRTSATDPAYQTIPQRTAWAKRLRSVYVPPAGHGILKVDYSQGELRIAACLADEPTMIRAYRDGVDLHLLTAAEVTNRTLTQILTLDSATQAQLRQAAKAVNFGLIYLMRPEGLQEYSRTAYGVTLTLEEATKYRDRFFSLYSALGTWHERYIAVARKHGRIRNPLGRLRHLPLINSPDPGIRYRQERQCVNSPVQSCLSDVMLLGMVELDRHYPDLWLFGMTHDSLEMYVPEDDLLGWARRVKEVLENLPFGAFDWAPQVRFVVDVEGGIGNLAEVKKLKL
jgi:DNA polymerase I-like protein with 3'-5' exonuclease and polymerase domains